MSSFLPRLPDSTRDTVAMDTLANAATFVMELLRSFLPAMLSSVYVIYTVNGVGLWFRGMRDSGQGV